MIRSEIRTLCRKELGETSEGFWSDTEINGYINLACTDIADRVRCIKANDYVNTIADQSDYVASAVLTNPLGVTEIYFKVNGTTWTKLVPMDRTELDRDFPSWLSVTSGMPYAYYFDSEEDLLQIYPAPDSTNAGSNYARVYYFKDHVDMAVTVAGDTSSPTIPKSLTPAIVKYVAAFGTETRGWMDKANDYWQKYYQMLRDYEINRLRKKPDDNIVTRIG